VLNSRGSLVKIGGLCIVIVDSRSEAPASERAARRLRLPCGTEEAEPPEQCVPGLEPWNKTYIRISKYFKIVSIEYHDKFDF